MSALPPSLATLLTRHERFDALKVADENVTVYLAQYPAGTVIEPHTHDTENWGVITAGTLYLSIDKNERAYNTGDWYHIPADREHSARFEVDTAEVEFWFAQ